ncbi:MAG TPA: DUF4190 domain-containing protein [Pirellulales bacterium]|nr:DUF4190 domain-containing protein [Pirellulales bacterium]
MVLVADDLPAGGKALCANCGHCFLFQPLGDMVRVSRKAIASLLLSIASLPLFCLTAVPALILGYWALADIQRHEDRLRGRNLAIAGLVLSVICASLSFIIWSTIWTFHLIQRATVSG